MTLHERGTDGNRLEGADQLTPMRGQARVRASRLDSELHQLVKEAAIAANHLDAALPRRAPGGSGDSLLELLELAKANDVRVAESLRRLLV